MLAAANVDASAMECRDARAACHIPECRLTLRLASMQQTKPSLPSPRWSNCDNSQ